MLSHNIPLQLKKIERIAKFKQFSIKGNIKVEVRINEIEQNIKTIRTGKSSET